MKKIKNKFIIVIILLIISILGIESYKTYVLGGADRGSYVILIDGEATLNGNKLVIDKKELLKSNDNIKTIGNESLVIVKWGDGSITRVGGNSDLTIQESEIEKNLLNIKISFRLNEGKTWSDVISFIGKDSYFHQAFSDTTASVRGTVFEVNLDKGYVYVNKHEVKLTKDTGETKIITENSKSRALSISEFSFIDFTKFLKLIKDKTWQKINIQLDKEFYDFLVKSISKIGDLEIIDDINELTLEKKEALYNKTLTEYQKLNFIDTYDIENYKKKLELKKYLIELADSGDKENLLITTLYDLKKLANNKQFNELAKVIGIISENKELLSNLDVSLMDYIDFNKFDNIKIPEGLKQQFINDFNDIKESINLSDFDLGNNSVINGIKKEAEKSILDTVDAINGVKDLLK